MNDKKLLDLAAKAADIELVTWGNPLKFAIKELTPIQMWNPLTDDGDALRLAVKLRIEPHFVSENVHGVILNGTDIGEWEQVLSENPLGNDPYAATRRAIVRAAAEIGKTK
jgi:hypothetical protein